MVSCLLVVVPASPIPIFQLINSPLQCRLQTQIKVEFFFQEEGNNKFMACLSIQVQFSSCCQDSNQIFPDYFLVWALQLTHLIGSKSQQEMEACSSMLFYCIAVVWSCGPPRGRPIWRYLKLGSKPCLTPAAHWWWPSSQLNYWIYETKVQDKCTVKTRLTKIPSAVQYIAEGDDRRLRSWAITSWFTWDNRPQGHINDIMKPPVGSGPPRKWCKILNTKHVTTHRGWAPRLKRAF